MFTGLQEIIIYKTAKKKTFTAINKGYYFKRDYYHFSYKYAQSDSYWVLNFKSVKITDIKSTPL